MPMFSPHTGQSFPLDIAAFRSVMPIIPGGRVAREPTSLRPAAL
jgi:hypothetical protein